MIYDKTQAQTALALYRLTVYFTDDHEKFKAYKHQLCVQSRFLMKPNPRCTQDVRHVKRKYNIPSEGFCVLFVNYPQAEGSLRVLVIQYVSL